MQEPIFRHQNHGQKNISPDPDIRLFLIPASLPCQHHNVSESGKEGWKLRGGKTYHKTPKTVSDPPPPPMTRFPAPVCPHPGIFLKGGGHRPDQFHSLRPPKLVLGGGGWFSTVCLLPPPKSHDTFYPPLAVFRMSSLQGDEAGLTAAQVLHLELRPGQIRGCW